MRPAPWSASLPLVVALAACQSDATSSPPMSEAALIPLPASIVDASGSYALGAATVVVHDAADAELARTADLLATQLRVATGLPMPVVASNAAPARDRIVLTSVGADPTLGGEGYELTVDADGVRVRGAPAGVFAGTRTLLQLLPASIEANTASAGPWTIAAGTIVDRPRFAWRGMMLDVARHFFPVDVVKRLVDRMAAYKLDRLHLHLSDDQGFRIAIGAYPALTTIGGSTAVGGGAGGYYTQADYAEIVAYAAARYVTVVPEIDMPAHTTAMMASYGQLTCDDVAPPLATGVFASSTLCTSDPSVVPFLATILGELAAITPGPYIHVGGDESNLTPMAEYGPFMRQIRDAVEASGKQMIAWEEASRASLGPTVMLQHWFDPALATDGVAQGQRLVLSPSSAAYLDMKYDWDVGSAIGMAWAGYVEVDRAYAWDPATLIAGVDESAIEGVEGALWTETVVTEADVDFLVYPRLLGIADVGWSRATGRGWDEYRLRLARHGARLGAMGVGYYASPLVDWSPTPPAP